MCDAGVDVCHTDVQLCPHTVEPHTDVVACDTVATTRLFTCLMRMCVIRVLVCVIRMFTDLTRLFVHVVTRDCCHTVVDSPHVVEISVVTRVIFYGTLLLPCGCLSSFYGSV